jgi:hypothetical protein
VWARSTTCEPAGCGDLDLVTGRQWRIVGFRGRAPIHDKPRDHHPVWTPNIMLRIRTSTPPDHGS